MTNKTPKTMTSIVIWQSSIRRAHDHLIEHSRLKYSIKEIATTHNVREGSKLHLSWLKREIRSCYEHTINKHYQWSGFGHTSLLFSFFNSKTKESSLLFSLILRRIIIYSTAKQWRTEEVFTRVGVVHVCTRYINVQFTHSICMNIMK